MYSIIETLLGRAMLHRFISFGSILVSAFFSLSAASPADEKMVALLKNFERYAEEQRVLWKIPGMAIAIVKDQDVVLEKGFGQRGIKNTQPVDQNTLFQIGSLSKAFTSTLLAIANDRDLLKWEDKVIHHLPSFHLYDPWVTAEFQVNDLCAQRSGLPPYAGDYQATLGFSADEIFHHLAYIKPLTSFRADYAYQNSFFLVASKILENKLSATFPILLHREIFVPLNMKNSNASLHEYLASPNRAEWLMRLKNGSTEIVKEDFPFLNWNYTLGPAGGINSTVSDMSKWLILQANQGQFEGVELVSKKNMRFLRRPGIYAGELEEHNMFYAQGWLHIENTPYPVILHDGSTLGVYNVAAFIPEEKLGIVILTNVRNTRLALALALQFFDQYFGKPDKNWSQHFLEQSQKAEPKTEAPQNISPPLPLHLYTGTYINPIYGELLVKIENKNLVLSLGKITQTFTLSHWDRDIFTLEDPFSGELPSKVSFLLNKDGIVSTVQLEFLSKEGAGDFIKK